MLHGMVAALIIALFAFNDVNSRRIYQASVHAKLHSYLHIRMHVSCLTRTSKVSLEMLIGRYRRLEMRHGNLRSLLSCESMGSGDEVFNLNQMDDQYKNALKSLLDSYLATIEFLFD